MRNAIRLLACGLLLGLVSGCASSRVSYVPPTGLPSELARIKTSGASGVESIDGKAVMSIWRLASLKAYPDDVVVLAPGKHRVHAVASRYEFPPPNAWLWLVAEPGTDYALKDETTKTDGGGNRVRFWLEDATTGMPVGGLAGSDDDPTKDDYPAEGLAKK
jgi:hypothetical protein